MGFVARRFAGTWSPPSVSDDGHWSTVGGPLALPSASGQLVTEDSAKRLSAVWACYKILTEAMGQMPLHLFQRRGDERERAREHPVDRLLTKEPHPELYPFEFKERMQGFAIFRQTAVAEIEWEGSRPVSLMPLHPDRVRRARIESPRMKVWEHLEDDGRTWRRIPDDEIFRLPGTPVLDFARDSFGAAQALEAYSSKTFQTGVRPSGFIAQDPGTSYSEDAKTLIKARIMENHGGSENAGGVLWLPEGLKWNQIGMTNLQAEFVASKAFTVADVSRWFRIPPYMLGLLESGTVSYASVSQQSLDFVVYTLMPWIRRWEEAVAGSLILDTDRFFAEFKTADMLRGTTEERYGVYAVALQWGILSVNEVRRLENMNPIDGGDEHLKPLNMGDTGPRGAEAGSPADRLLQALTSDAAGRIVNRERKALPKLLEKGDDAAIDDFYAGHAEFVADALHVPPAVAQSYITAQRKRAVDVEAWDTDALVAELSAMAGVNEQKGGAFSVPSISVNPVINVETDGIARAIREAPAPTVNVAVDPTPIQARVDSGPIAQAILESRQVTTTKDVERDENGRIVRVTEKSA